MGFTNGIRLIIFWFILHLIKSRIKKDIKSARPSGIRINPGMILDLNKDELIPL
jgi:hypothetical protein